MIILSIETAIVRGSLSIVADGRQIAGWTSETDGLRAEQLMSRIDGLLRSTGLARTKLGAIAVSSGPGSFTGIRIGLAAALGLKDALGIALVTVPALEAIAFTYEHTGMVAVPMGRGGAAAQRFVSGQPVGQPTSIALDDLFNAAPANELLLYPDITLESGTGIRTFDRNIAFAIATIAKRQPSSHSAPIFLSKGY
jgi:tRNA threonylcarbamoyladenosine biosynthesis protein TsaB